MRNQNEIKDGQEGLKVREEKGKGSRKEMLVDF